MSMIWTNSGDSHFLEPDDLWQSRLPKALADQTPRAEKDPARRAETAFLLAQALWHSRPERPKALTLAIEAKRDFWLAQSELQTAVNGGGRADTQQQARSSTTAQASGGGH